MKQILQTILFVNAAARGLIKMWSLQTYTIYNCRRINYIFRNSLVKYSSSKETPPLTKKKVVQIFLIFYFWQKLFQINSLKFVQKKQINVKIMFLLVEE